MLLVEYDIDWNVENAQYQSFTAHIFQYQEIFSINIRNQPQESHGWLRGQNSNNL
jgi:hypothetical protein